MQKEPYDVVVVGAGIVGCAVAYHLARSGLKVALLDKGSVAGEASQAAAGMLAPLGDEPPDQAHPLQQLAMAALRYYEGLDEQLKQETGIDIGLVKVVLATWHIRSKKTDLPLSDHTIPWAQNSFEGQGEPYSSRWMASGKIHQARHTHTC